MQIEIFGKDNCPYCDMAVRVAQQYIQESSHTYEYKKLGKDFDRDFMMEQFPGARTFPQIRVDGENVGGYTEFKALIDANL